MPVNQGSLPSPQQEAQSLLTPHRTQILREAVESAEKLATSMADLSNTQVNALLNALGNGPDCRSAEDRRRQLARLLAQRTYRERNGAGTWTKLTALLVTEIAELERRSQWAQDTVFREQQGFWQKHPDVLPVAVEEMRMQIVESFLYTLERWVLIHRTPNSEDAEEPSTRAVDTPPVGTEASATFPKEGDSPHA